MFKYNYLIIKMRGPFTFNDFDEQEKFIESLFPKQPEKDNFHDICTSYNIFTEYNAMKDRKNMNDFDAARFLLLRAIVKIDKIDPIKGEKKSTLTADEQIIWNDIDKDIMNAGHALNNYDGLEGMEDGLVWSFTPKCLRHKIRTMWNGIGNFRYCVVSKDKTVHKDDIESNTIWDECIQLNTFLQYNIMKTQKLDKFEIGIFLVLAAIIRMVEFDPIFGDMKPDMSGEEILYWKRIDEDITNGGKLLYKAGKELAMSTEKLWNYIPKRLKRDVDERFEGIGNWNS